MQYIDYGNVEVVEDSKVVTLPDDYAALPAFAKRYWLLTYKPSGHQADEVSHTQAHNVAVCC